MQSKDIEHRLIPAQEDHSRDIGRSYFPGVISPTGYYPRWRRSRSYLAQFASCDVRTRTLESGAAIISRLLNYIQSTVEDHGEKISWVKDMHPAKEKGDVEKKDYSEECDMSVCL